MKIQFTDREQFAKALADEIGAYMNGIPYFQATATDAVNALRAAWWDLKPLASDADADATRELFRRFGSLMDEAFSLLAVVNTAVQINRDTLAEQAATYAE